MASERAREREAGERAILEAWLDEALSSGAGRLVGRGYQASAYLFESPVGGIVVKKAHDSPLLGFAGRRALRREADIYEQLAGVAGVPRSYGLLHGHLVIEHIEGESLRRRDATLNDRERFFGQLLATLDAMHAAGIAHGDLKRKDNLLVGPGERPYVIDFGIAWRTYRGAPRWRRAIFDLVSQMDYNAWIKLKYQRRTDDLSPEDAQRHRPLLLERAARAIRIPWQKLTLRRLRKRRRSPTV